jgi:hypothetical protein
MLVICPHCAKPHEVEAEKVVVRPTDEELIEFDIFRDNYKGKKRGLITEMDNFTKKHKDWKEVLLILNRLYLDWGEQKFIPHFQTFINQRQWEMFDIKPKKLTNPYGEEFNWRKK